MTDDETILQSFGGTARLFPLPNLVLFPQCVQGLHIFEPRYRQMMADTVADDMLMALVLLKTGWDIDYDGRPPIESVACLGHVGPWEELHDGRYNLRLKGIRRIRILEELATPKKYRTARVELLAEIIPDCLTTLVSLRHALAEAVLPRFPAGGDAYRQLEELFQGETPLGQLCDSLGYALPLPLPLKQSLLAEPDVAVRSTLMADALRLPTQGKARKFPPDFSSN